jgi:multiple sugar transport system permease protein/putative aldouronate transport system permease protein
MIKTRFQKGTVIQDTGADRVFNIINFTFLALILVAVLYPLIYVLSSSFSDAEAVLAGRVRLFPVGFTFDGYRAVLENREVWLGYGNTIIYTAVGTTINVALTIMLAYPLSRRDFVGRGAIMFFVTFTMFFNGGLIPTYLLIRNLGLLDTRLVMVLHSAIGVWNVIVARTFLQATIPQELYDSATVDGASNIRVLVSVVLPLSGPIIAVISLFYGVAHWNSFFAAFIYLRSPDLRPLQIILREILVENSERMGSDFMVSLSAGELEAMTERQFLQALLQYALIVVATLPILLVYPFVQKYFVRGVMIGALKG